MTTPLLRMSSAAVTEEVGWALRRMTHLEDAEATVKGLR